MTEDQEFKPLTPQELDEKIKQTHPDLTLKNISESETHSGSNLTNQVTSKTNGMFYVRGGEGYIATAWIFMLIAVAFAISGINTLYNNDYTARIVGGDAYNYIIYATRGTALVCVGIVSAVISLTMAMLANITRNSKRYGVSAENQPLENN